MNSTLPASQVDAPFIESRADESADALRARMNENGYLFFRDLVPAADVNAVRHDVLQLCQSAGWLDADKPLMDGIANPDVAALSEGQPDYMAVYRQILRLPSFHDFPNHPALLGAAAKIIDGEVLVHRRRIGRVTFPNNVAVTTSPHQDWFYIRGSEQTYTCWMPLGDCPLELGGLAVWPGSQHRGLLEHAAGSRGAGGHQLAPEPPDSFWHSSPFEAGDALFFHSLTAHKALPNLTPNRLRLSTDNRFQLSEDEIHPASTQPHFGLDA